MERHVRNGFLVIAVIACFSKQEIQGVLSIPEAESRDDLIQGIHWKCNSNSDCTVANSSCVENQCRCPPGQIFNSNMTVCLKVATAYGDSCTENIQCSAYLLSGAICKDNLCFCAEGYYYMHGMCRPYSALHEKCMHDCYVYADFEASSCQNGICKCSPGYYQREYRTCRREGKQIGDPCEINVDCTFHKNATCKSGACSLDSGSKLVSGLFLDIENAEADNTTKEVKIGDNCDSDMNCTSLGNAICGPLGTCICNRAHFASASGKCVPEIGEYCREDEDPPMNRAVCRNGRWVCNTGYIVAEDNRSCLKVTKSFGFSCRFDKQCQAFGPDAVCDKKCVCNEKSRYVPEKMFCWTKRTYGESCKANIDCYVDNSTNILCKNHVCSCPDGWRLNSEGTRCVSNSAEIGMACDVDENCRAENSVCSNSTCTCTENYYESFGDCVPGINANCTADEYCAPRNSICQSGKCTCEKDFAVASTSLCLPFVEYNQECIEDVQCRLPNTVCIAPQLMSPDPAERLVRICLCEKGYDYRYGRCFKRKLLGEKCTNLGECYLNPEMGKAVCKNGQCACSESYIPLNETACVPNANAMFLTGSATLRAASPGIVACLLFVAVALARFD